MAYKAIRNPDRCPSHPGAVIKDILDGFDVPKTDIVNMPQISRRQLHGILSGRKPLSPDIAARIAKLIGGSTESWLRMQADFDVWHVSREVDVSSIPIWR